jgi:hypothetical protein
MVAGDWLFHWDNALVHFAAKVTNWLAARDPPYSPDLVLADYFLFPRIKRDLPGLILTLTFKKEWEGGVRSITAAPRRGVQAMVSAPQKYVSIGGEYVEKS